jgi:hypothetical protein
MLLLIGITNRLLTCFGVNLKDFVWTNESVSMRIGHIHRNLQ